MTRLRGVASVLDGRIHAPPHELQGLIFDFTLSTDSNRFIAVTSNYPAPSQLQISRKSRDVAATRDYTSNIFTFVTKGNEYDDVFKFIKKLWTAQQAQVAAAADPRMLSHQSTSCELVPGTNYQCPAVIPTQSLTATPARPRTHENTWNLPRHSMPITSSYPKPESTQIYVASGATLNYYTCSANTHRQPAAPQQPTTQAAQTQSASTAIVQGAGARRQHTSGVVQNIRAAGLDRHDIIAWLRRKFPGASNKAALEVSRAFKGIGGEQYQVRIPRHLTSHELQELDAEREVDESDSESSSESSDDEVIQPKFSESELSF
ncbi:hypothetical protein AC578_4815 [Pseudocercospora eumusae]|uniref:Uncharacterized protein n=1 Tax=Pseudocercospora eumusae TaxID=321146 RepID=A0A139HLF0_9PEZI|nr:hypothetical protein AC578_4815 [Pseudocercospora eumusae]